ncbi:hypothetical protein PQX77_021851 [Marasmius sp. AFHP31]|nr:hypothetical protein PQX77_021851 [Marasmius sp. AFHP31]
MASFQGGIYIKPSVEKSGDKDFSCLKCRANDFNGMFPSLAPAAGIYSRVLFSSSKINVVILTVMHGREYGWVILNALAVYWITAGKSLASPEPDNSSELPTHTAPTIPPTLSSLFVVSIPASTSHGQISEGHSPHHTKSDHQEKSDPLTALPMSPGRVYARKEM